MIKYSIIIPVYNIEEYVEKTLDSLSSIPDNTEIIIVNDGSTDDTWRNVENYVAGHDLRDIQLLTQPNAGVSVARNTGIEAAKGEYLLFVDGDDICKDGFIDIIDRVTDDKPDMIVWRFYTDQGGRVKESQKEFDKELYTAKEFTTSLLKGINRIRIGSFAVKKHKIEEKGIRFTEGCAICEDVEFMYKAVLSSDRIVTVNDICYTYMKREGSAMNTSDMRFFQAPVAIQRIYGYADIYCSDIMDEYIEDSLKYGLYITHCMYSFDSCLRYVKNGADRRGFLRRYFDEYMNIEDYIKKAKKKMMYKPEIFSAKRLGIFLLSRRIYTIYIYCFNKKTA